jgi:hypothetical protein
MAERDWQKLIDELLEALEWMDALFEAGDFRADHKAEALAVRRKVKAAIRKAKKVRGHAR